MEARNAAVTSHPHVQGLGPQLFPGRGDSTQCRARCSHVNLAGEPTRAVSGSRTRGLHHGTVAFWPLNYDCMTRRAFPPGGGGDFRHPPPPDQKGSGPWTPGPESNRRELRFAGGCLSSQPPGVGAGSLGFEPSAGGLTGHSPRPEKTLPLMPGCPSPTRLRMRWFLRDLPLRGATPADGQPGVPSGTATGN